MSTLDMSYFAPLIVVALWLVISWLLWRNEK